MTFKNILITGVSGGIGKSLALFLLKNNYKVIGISRKNPEIRDKNFSFYSLNLNDIENISILLKEIVSIEGKIDGFVHCAGVHQVQPISLFKVHDFEKLMRIHVTVPFEILKYLSKNKYSDGASIVLISSLAAHEGAPGLSFYAAAKGALEGFLSSATAELMSKHRINIIAPGVIESGMGENYKEKLDEKQRENLAKFYPMGLGTNEDLNNLIEFLLSSKSKWLTGQKILLDGGHLSVPR